MHKLIIRNRGPLAIIMVCVGVGILFGNPLVGFGVALTIIGVALMTK